MKITVQATVKAPIESVWKSYITPEDILQWNAASDDWHTTRATVDLRPGGTFSSRMEAKDGSFGFDFAGTYTKVVPNSLIEYEFGGRIATIEFKSGTDGVKVQISFDSEDTHPVDQQREGWQAILNRFKSHAESQK